VLSTGENAAELNVTDRWFGFAAVVRIRCHPATPSETAVTRFVCPAPDCAAAITTFSASTNASWVSVKPE
jgi:hypothetical protein